MIDKIKKFLISFCIINTGSLLGAFIFIAIFDFGEKMNQKTYWQVTLAAFLLTCVIEGLFLSDTMSKEQAKIRIIVSYIIVNISIIGSAYVFNWIEENFVIQTLTLFIIIFVVYVFVYAISYTKDIRVADELNKKLKEINDK